MTAKLVLAVIALGAAVAEGAQSGTALEWRTEAPAGDRIRGRAEFADGGGERTLAFEIRMRPEFTGFVARRLTPACRTRAGDRCGLVLARLAQDGVDLFYGDPQQGRASRLHLDRQASASGSEVTLTARAPNAAQSLRLTSSASSTRFEVAGVAGERRYSLTGTLRSLGAEPPAPEHVALLALVEVVAQAISAAPASSLAGATLRSQTANTTEPTPPVDDSAIDCLGHSRPGCPPDSSGPDRSCWICDLCQGIPGGDTLGGCLGVPPGVDWGGGGLVDPVAAPDLVVVSVSRGSATAPPGSTIFLKSRVRNAGVADAGSFEVRFFLERKATGARVELNGTTSKTVNGLRAGSSQDVTASPTIRSKTALGTYLVCASASSAAGEVDTNDNQKCGQELEVTLTP